MNKQCLDVHQMHHLKELGMDTRNALLEWVKDTSIPNSKYEIFPHGMKTGTLYDIIPAYTLQDVLDAMPKEIMYENKRCWASIDLEDGFIGYYYENYSLYYKWAYFEAVMKDESIIDAAYELLVWCIEQGYVETNKNE